MRPFFGMADACQQRQDPRGPLAEAPSVSRRARRNPDPRPSDTPPENL